MDKNFCTDFASKAFNCFKLTASYSLTPPATPVKRRANPVEPSRLVPIATIPFPASLTVSTVLASSKYGFTLAEEPVATSAAVTSVFQPRATLPAPATVAPLPIAVLFSALALAPRPTAVLLSALAPAPRPIAVLLSALETAPRPYAAALSPLA